MNHTFCLRKMIFEPLSVCEIFTLVSEGRRGLLTQHDKIFSDNSWALYAAVDLRVKEQTVSKRESELPVKALSHGNHMLNWECYVA